MPRSTSGWTRTGCSRRSDARSVWWASSRRAPGVAEHVKFDPYALLQALDRHRVTYIVIGGFARVIQGTEEITRGLDIVPSTREENLRRLELAVRDVGARRTDGQELTLDQKTLAAQPVHELTTHHGEL